MKHFVALVELAPLAPPCFADRLAWVEYLVSSAQSQRVGGNGEERGPLLFEKGRAVRFDYGWSFCTDCLQEHRDRMANAGACRPDFVKRQDAARRETATC